MSDEKKTTGTTSEEVRVSVSSLYSELLNKRRKEKEEKDLRKAQEKEERQREKEEQEAAQGKLSKKERRQAELDSWKEVIVGLTGDDLEYSKPKKNKKKYRKWIGDDDTTIAVQKPKKQKKKNYHKEFDPEINMLKSLVADQNKFTNDLLRRFQNAVGPATKDAAPLNKTMVELAAAINTSRSNSLGVLKEIGTLKKVIADLYYKQLEADAKRGAGIETTDLGLMGSRAAAMMDSVVAPSGSFTQPTEYSTPINETAQPASYYDNYQKARAQSEVASSISNNNQSPQIVNATTSNPVMDEFDPDSWEGPELPKNSTAPFENDDKHIVVEWNKRTGEKRFKAVRDDNGEEMVGYPLPASNVYDLPIDEKTGTVRGQIDEIYKLEIKE